MRLAITGHRPNKLGNDYDLTGPWMYAIRDALTEIIKWKRPTMMITGMALGIDQLWAELAIAHKIPFTAAIPCLNHSLKWPQASRDRYNTLLSLAAVVHMCSEENYTPSCMQKRNEWMVDNCDELIAVWNGTPSGTRNCVLYADDNNRKPYVIVDPDKLKPYTQLSK